LSNPHLEAELLAYLDGALDDRDRARVEAHLVECPRCAAELERLRILQRELDATLDTALTPVRLPAASDRRIRDRLRARTEPRLRWGLWRRRGLVAQALLAVLVLLFSLNTIPVLRLPPPAEPHETLVLGQDRLAPGSRAALRVLVRSAGEAAVEPQPIEGAEVVVRVGRTPGLASIVYTGRTGVDGTADVAFTVPEDLEGQASLVVETASAGGEDRVVRPITVARDYKLFLSSDKPAYRPGQDVHVRVLALDAVDLRPAAGQEVVFALLDPDGGRLDQGAATVSEFGVAGLDFSLPPDVVSDHYTLRAALGETTSERALNVGAYELPAFRVTLDTGRTFYSPGDRVTGSVRAEYFFGRPVSGGLVTLRGIAGEPGRAPVQVLEVLGETGADGAFEFTFDLPTSLGRSAAVEPASFDLGIEVEVVDAAGQREGIRRVLPVAAQPILIRAIPEGGLIKPGVENVIYVLTAYADGQPAETTLTVRVAGQERTLATGPYGLAELRTVPDAPPAPLEVHARDAQGAEGQATFDFPFDRSPAALLLRAERAVYEVGDTLLAEALVAGAGAGSADAVYLDVVRARQTVATLSAPVEDGRAVFALDLDGTMVGTLELRAYRVSADGGIVADSRLVVVDAPRQVAVAVAADQDRYQPGDTAHLEFQTTIDAAGSASGQPIQSAGQSVQAAGQPIQSALGIGVVDESVYALEDLPPSFARAYFLLERELVDRRGQMQGVDLPALLDAETEVREAQDVAARAAWAGAPGTDFTLSARSTAEKAERAPAPAPLSNGLGIVLVLLPLLLGGVVLQGLRPTGVLWSAVRRTLTGGLVLLLASPLVALVVGGLMWLLWVVLGAGAPVVVLAVVVALLLGLAVHGWRRPDTRVQLATGLLAAYLALGGLLVLLAARGGGPHILLVVLTVATFLLAVAALATLGQGLVLEGWTRAGWGITLLGLILIPLVVYLPFVPALDSGLTRALGSPALYAGPVGWATGCAASPTEAPVAEPTRAPEMEAEEAEATAAPTPAPTPTTTPPPSPVEPFPLRQVFPETLYWSAEALTDENGRLTLDLPLADNVTTWRLTALASTQEGELGVTTYDLVVFRDFFVDLDLAPAVQQGETVTVTVTLYNYLRQAQTVRIEPAPAGWYDLVSDPRAISLPPNGVATASFSIRAVRTGDFSLEVTAVGDRASDAVAREVTVEPGTPVP